jgi:hypothetical protein
MEFIKELLLYKKDISENLDKLTEADIVQINKKYNLKLIKTEIFFENEITRLQMNTPCVGELKRLIKSTSCVLNDGTINYIKSNIYCRGKIKNTYICIGETVEASNSKIVGTHIRIDIEYKDNLIKHSAFPVYNGGIFMPYKIESTYALSQ